MGHWSDKFLHSFIALQLITLAVIVVGSYIGINVRLLPVQIGLVYQIAGFVMILGSAWHSYTISTDEGTKIRIEPISYRSLHGWGITTIISGLLIQLIYM